MNILFVNYSDFTTASLNHIGVFANRLCALGHDCIVAVPSGLESIGVVAGARFRPALFSELLERPALFGDGRPAGIIHAWTPRECIRRFVLDYQRATPDPARLLVHLEDNEEFLIADFTGRPVGELRGLGFGALETLVHPNLPHPVHCRTFPYLADAVTHLTVPLADLAPRSVRRHLLPPALDGAYLEPRTADESLRRRHGLGPGERVLVYTGSNTFANDREIRELYLAVHLLNQRGIPTRLLRTGIIRPGFMDDLPEDLRPRVLELGFVPKAELPGLLALADVLVQPGKPGPFNDYRLPSKLPEFLASGRPVVLPRSNIAHCMTDGTEALFLTRGDAAEIAQACARLFGDPALGARLGSAGAAFARRHFDPELRTRELQDLYGGLLARPARPLWRRLADGAADELTLLAEMLAEQLSAADPAGAPAPPPGLPAPSQDLGSLGHDCPSLARDVAALARLKAEEHALGVRALHAQRLDRERQIGALRLDLEEKSGQIERLVREEQSVQSVLRAAWAEHASVSGRIRELDLELDAREAKIRRLQASLSWRLTAPLRSLRKRLGGGEKPPQL